MHMKWFQQDLIMIINSDIKGISFAIRSSQSDSAQMHNISGSEQHTAN